VAAGEAAVLRRKEFLMFATGVVLVGLALLLVALFGPSKEAPVPAMYAGVVAFYGGAVLILVSLGIWLYRVVPMP
jgi:hypothetical protein